MYWSAKCMRYPSYLWRLGYLNSFASTYRFNHNFLAIMGVELTGFLLLCMILQLWWLFWPTVAVLQRCFKRLGYYSSFLCLEAQDGETHKSARRRVAAPGANWTSFMLFTTMVIYRNRSKVSSLLLKEHVPYISNRVVFL